MGAFLENCEINHNFAVWQGYGLNEFEVPTGCALDCLLRDAERFVRAANCSINRLPFARRTNWEMANDSVRRWVQTLALKCVRYIADILKQSFTPSLRLSGNPLTMPRRESIPRIREVLIGKPTGDV